MIGRRVASMEELELPGDYFYNPVADPNGDHSLWFFLPIHTPGATRFERSKPGDGLHRIASPVWTITENSDGSVSAQPSIACGRGSPGGEYWHGYLDAGHVWREC